MNNRELWLSLDDEIRAEIDQLTAPYQAPIKIEHATSQTLTTWTNSFDRSGAGQFTFNLGKRPRHTQIKLNFSWNNVGPGGTHTLNRWVEELRCILRNHSNASVVKATAYLPNTQDFLPWCQFIEVREYGFPQWAYVVWNGDTIIPSKAKMIERDNAKDWTFNWNNRMTLEQALATTKGF